MSIKRELERPAPPDHQQPPNSQPTTPLSQPASNLAQFPSVRARHAVPPPPDPYLPLLQRLDETTDLLNAIQVLIQRLSKTLGMEPPTMPEISAVLNTEIVISVIGSQLGALRDPANYWGEENNHAE